MTGSIGDLIKYRIARAKETLEEAQILAASKHWNACVNRLYYACFYVVSALVARHKFASSKHSGIRSFFNLQFVKKGTVSKEVASIYNDLFERRQEGDYEDYLKFQESDVKTWMGEAELFVKTIGELSEKG